MNLFKEK